MNKIILAGVVTIAAGLILAATAWNFAAVASLPTKYVTVEENLSDHERIERKLDKIIDYLIGRNDE